MKTARTWLVPFVLVGFPSATLPAFAGSQAVAQQGARLAPPVSDEPAIAGELSRREYEFSPVRDESGVWSAPNRAQGLRSRVSAHGIELFPRAADARGAGAAWRMELRTLRLERGEEQLALAPASIAIQGSRASLDHGVLAEWFENRPDGIEQGWTLEDRPRGEGALRIVLGLPGVDAVVLEGERSALLTNANARLPYRNLRAWDARGRDVRARFVESENGLAVEVEDEGARYPLTIDPTLAWTAEGNQAGAHLGNSVASAGDVNGDGYDDVIVGAFMYDNGEADEGRAFVYLGSGTGLATSAAWTAESNQASAFFGYSVATAGDVNGDGYSDVIVGARSYDNGEADEGAVFVYLGSMTGLGLSAAWIAEGDQAGADFGYSVATAGDVNGDSYSDVIVGAEEYDNVEMGEGAAFVYLGSMFDLGVDGTPANADWMAESNQAGARFGASVASAGDVNGGGYSDVIVGAEGYDNPQVSEGAAFLYLGSASFDLDPDGTPLNADWTTESDQASAFFGYSVATAGDVNGDGYSDVIVGSQGYDNGEPDEGRAFLYLGSGAGLSTSAAWTAESDQASASFGYSVATAGDVNGDGYGDVIVGSDYYDGVQPDVGRAFLYLGSGAVLSAGASWTAESDQASARFGYSVATAGDVNGDGYSDVIVGCDFFDNGEADEGAAFLSLGTPPLIQVLYERQVTEGLGAFGGDLDGGDIFAGSMAPLGDFDGDGVEDLAVGAPYDDDGGTMGLTSNVGAVWILLMNRDGSVKDEKKINDASFSGALDDGDLFGTAIASIGDLDGNNVNDLAIGAQTDDANRGSIWIVKLLADGTVLGQNKISSPESDADEFGVSVEAIGDLDGDGVVELAVGAYLDDGSGANRGALYIVFLNGDGTLDHTVKIGDTTGGFGSLDDNDEFGRSAAWLGDLDGAGGSKATLAVGSDGDDSFTGAVWILFLSAAGTVSNPVPIKEGQGLPDGILDPGDLFGVSLEALGSVGGPGVIDLAVGAYQDDEGSTSSGSVWVLSLNADGSVADYGRVNTKEGNFGGDMGANDGFGLSVAALGDLDGDGRIDLAAGAQDASTSAPTNGTFSGALWVLFLNDGTLGIGANATTWDGSTDSVWTDASNWSNGTPDPAKTAIIPDAATTPNDPSITVSSQQCNSLWIQADGTLDISAGTDSLGVFGGATVSGPITGVQDPITGTGQLVFEEAGTLGGDGTIGLSFTPFAVRSDADLELQGGPLTINGSFQGNADVLVASGATIDIGGTLQVLSDLAIDGSFTIGDGVTVSGTLSSSSSSELTVVGTGACVVAGQLCVHGEVSTSCSLSVENSIVGSTSFEAENGWPAGVSIDVPGTVNLLTPDLVVAADLMLVEGTFAVGVTGSIAADSIVVQDGATFDVTGFQTSVLGQAPITVEAGGKLNIGAGGTLVLEGNTLTVDGTLCLAGSADDPATLTGSAGNRYTLDLLSGSTLAAKNFVFEFMAAQGIVIPADVNLGVPPLDLRAGVFDRPDPTGVLLDIRRPAATTLRYLQFSNTSGPIGPPPFNVRTLASSSPIKLVNWSGAYADEPFEDDPGAGEPGLIEWAPPENSSVTFTAHWGSDHVKLKWTSTAEVDCDAYVLKRSPEPPGTYATIAQMLPTGPGVYSYRDFAVQAQSGYRYRLYEHLTHGVLRLLGEQVLPSSSAPTVLLPVWGKPAPPTPPLQPLVVGPGGPYLDVRTALRELARSGQRDPVTLELASGRHEPFEIGRELDFDLCIVARQGAVIWAGLEPVRIEGLAAERSIELVDLVIDVRRAHHPSLVIEDSEGVVLMQGVDLRGRRSSPRLRLTNARAVALQGGAIEGGLVLERGSRATASGVKWTSFELTGGSVLETRGERGPRAARAEGREPGWSPAFPADVEVEPGSRWLRHPAAPLLRVEDGEATLEAGGPGLAWLGVAQRLGFQVRAQALLEGVLMLEPSGLASIGRVRSLAGGRASWRLGAVPPGECIHLQGLVFDPLSGRVCLSDVVRLER